MNFVDAIKTCFTKYADFTGCASKHEFWWFMLFLFVASLVLDIVSGSASLAFSVATALPSSAVLTRRLHDTNRSGWLQLLYLIPLLGWILLAVWCSERSVRPTRYGDGYELPG